MIIINGVPYDEEQFAEMQRQQEEEQRRFWEDLKNTYDCNCALIGEATQADRFMYNRPYTVICSLDRAMILDPSTCHECKAYNNTKYE